MFNTEDIIFIILITVESVIGMLGNGYIGLVIWIDYTEKKKISPINCILTSLAVSRICLLCVILLNDILMAFSLSFKENDKVLLTLSVFWTLTNYLSMFFATCLNVFYFLKIATFSHSLFLWLKWRIDRMIHWILLGCLAISSMISLLLIMVPNFYYELHKIEKHKRNFTEMFTVSKIQSFSPFTLFNLLVIVPFIISLISFSLLTLSLWRHTKQMKLNVTGGRDPSMEAHMGAMKSVASFLFLLFIYCGACILVTFSYLMEERKLVVMVGEAVTILYPLGHSLILIIGNNKLRQASVRMLRCKKKIAT